MFSNRILVSSALLGLLALANTFYIPESGEDWTQLTPEFQLVAGSLDSLPFDFGIVVNPYSSDAEGENEESDSSSYAVGITTTFSTSMVTEAPQATKLGANVQIQGGQEEGQDGAEAQSAEYNEEQQFETKWDKREEDEEASQSVQSEEVSDEDYDVTSPVYAVSCRTDSALAMTLEDSVLRDSSGRIGSIVGNRQFQFDGPVPQYGTIYAAGWYVSPQGKLELGSSTKFYQCASGEFYNLYDQPIDSQCVPVKLDVVELIDC